MTQKKSPGYAARHVVRSQGTAALATTMAPVPNTALANEETGAGGPYSSLVLSACRHDGSPILLISKLADHTRNIEHDPRISLLFDGTGGLESRLSGPRISLQGRAHPSHDASDRWRYLSRHADAKGYADFTDFGFYHVEVTAVHMINGFGEITWISGEQYRFDAASEALAEAEDAMVRHVNEAHQDTPAAIAATLGLPGEGWIMTGIDPEGADIRLGGTFARYAFPDIAATREDAKHALIAMRKAALASPNGLAPS